MQEPWTHREAKVNGVRLHYVEAGSGPLVVLLHGFPEFWYSWHHQIPALAQAGFRVIAPDMRGYNLSDKPKGVVHYRIEKLVGDVVGLIQHMGKRKASVVGHDWGGGVAWETALRRPEFLDRLVVLNCPHPSVFARELRTREQLKRSWYMFFFQIPRLPELSFRRRNFAGIRSVFRKEPIRPNAFTRGDIEKYREAIARPGALTAAINYYRAAFRYDSRSALRDRPRLEVPTLLLWGEEDRHLGIRLTEGNERWVSNIQVVRIPNASHWVQSDAPEVVNEQLIRFLKR